MGRRVDNVADHRARRRERARAPSVQHNIAYRVAFQVHGVERIVHARQGVGRGDKGRVYARFDTLFAVLADGKQFEGIPKLFAVRDILAADPADTLAEYLGIRYFGMECERGQNREFVQRVVALDVGGRIRLGITERFRYRTS